MTTDRRPHPQADAGSAVSARVCDSLSDPLYTHGPQPQCRVSNPSERGWVTEVQLTAAAAQHGHRGDWDRARPSALDSSICSLCQVGELAEQGRRL